MLSDDSKSDPLPGWYVEQIPSAEARAWIPKYHYSGTIGTSNGRFYGAFDGDGRLMVVIGVGAPNNPNGVAKQLGLTDWAGNLEVTRVAAHPEAPRNAATRALALVCKKAHEDLGLEWLFSYADTDQHHHGGIYQGLNALYVGLTANSSVGMLIIDGERVHPRSSNAKYGTSSPKKLEAMGHEVTAIPRSKKHIYILPIGDKRSKRAIRSILAPRIVPYPKRQEQSDTAEEPVLAPVIPLRPEIEVRPAVVDAIYRYPVAGAQPIIYFPATRRVFEAGDFDRLLARANGQVTVDIETTGLDTYARDWKIRLVQVGTRDEAWVLMADRWPSEIRDVLRRADKLVVHTQDNFDLLGLDHAGLGDLEELASKTINTHILAHLLDPRAAGEGTGRGHGLKELSQFYVDPKATDGKSELHEVFRKEYKTTIEKGWAVIDIDHPKYVTYAGLDVIYGSRLFDALADELRSMGLAELSRFEHRVSRICSQMVKRGFALDVPYTEDLVVKFTDEAFVASELAKGYGLENVNSPAQVGKALMAMGWEPKEFTSTGQPKADKAVLVALEDAGNPLAKAIREAKRAGKWRESYAQAMLDVRDENDRIHPKLSPLKARTARMAISRPPLQQLPSRDTGGESVWRVRRALVADPGHLIFSVDYATLEMRLLAVMADVELLKKAIWDEQDLHEFTAALLYGPEFTKEQRKIAKNVGYGKVYGGGVAGVARLTGAPVDAVRKAIAEYDRVFPEIKAYSDRLRTEALSSGLIVRSPIGRRLPVDEDRIYAATNYVIQSLARDILAEALLRADDAGLTPYMLLPVHDEIVGQAPASEVEEVGTELGRIMAIPDYEGVPIDTDCEVGGFSWGSLYGAPDDVPQQKKAA